MPSAMLMRSPLARDRRSPLGFIKPCQPILSRTVPTGPEWTHEIKPDGFRLVARKDGEKVRLWSRQGRSWTREFAAITAVLRALAVSQIVLDGEAVAHCDQGLPDFLRLLSGDGHARACLFAFDVLMLGGDDLRPLPLSIRRNMLAQLPLEGALQFSGHMDGPDGEAMFRHACRNHFEAGGQAVPIGPVRALAQAQEPGLRALFPGRVAQRIEHQPSKLRGAGSSPAAVTNGYSMTSSEDARNSAAR